jgi:thiamine pyrophosphate-dependent acetolactate synthase large subunit-like protein
MSQTVAGTLINALEEIGVKQIFGLIGDSLNSIADAVRHSKIEWIGVRHEEGAALAAAGQAKLTGRLAVCRGTTGPGSTHLVAGLYEACREHAPVLALSGHLPRNLQGIDYMRATEPNVLFRDVSLYTETISGHRRRLCRPRRRAFDAAARRPPREGRGQRFEPRHAQAVGFKAEKPGELREAVSQALKAEGPAIVDCVVAADEMPNLPHLDLEKIANFAEAKIREAVLAAMGG